jgi:hypothetical protein
MRAFADLENLVRSAFDRTTRRYHRAMSEDTQSPFEATRALKHQESNLGGASFVVQDVEERKNNVEESKQTKQSREEMREEGQSGEGKSSEAKSDIDMPEIESDEPSRDDDTDEINEE